MKAEEFLKKLPDLSFMLSNIIKMPNSDNKF